MVLQENVSPLQWVGVSNPYHMQNNSNSHVEEFVVVYQLCVACSRYIWLPVKCLAAANNLYGFKSLTGFDVLHTLTLATHLFAASRARYRRMAFATREAR